MHWWFIDSSGQIRSVITLCCISRSEGEGEWRGSILGGEGRVLHGCTSARVDEQRPVYAPLENRSYSTVLHCP